MKRLLLLIYTVFSLISLGLQASEELKPDALRLFKANYKVFRKGSELGEAYRNLLKNDDQYVLETDSKISWLFLSDNRHERSTFRVAKENLVIPLQYEFKRTGTGRDKITHTIFGDKKIITNYKSKDYEFERQLDILDPQIYQLVMRQQLILGKTEFEYPLIRRGKLSTYRFKVVAQEELKIPYGKVATIKLERVRESSRRKTVIWVAPSLNYTMAKMTQYKDGKEQADLQLSWLQFEDNKKPH